MKDADNKRTLVGAIKADGSTATDSYQQWLQENYGLKIQINHRNIDNPTNPNE